MLNKNIGLKQRQTTDTIEIYRTKTKPNKNITRHDLHKMALENGKLGIEYHYIIQLNGALEIGRPIDKISIGSEKAISICIVGGLTDTGQLELPFYTTAQDQTLRTLKKEMNAIYEIKNIVQLD